MLYDDCVYMPFSMIKSRLPWLRILFGDSIFIRPDNKTDSFAEFDTHEKGLYESFNECMRREYILPYTMTMITKYKPIADVKYRIWVYEGKIVGSSPFSDTHEFKQKKVPKKALKLTKKIIGELGNDLRTYVVDIAKTDSDFRMIELNLFSTTEWCDGLDGPKMLKKIRKMEGE